MAAMWPCSGWRSAALPARRTHCMPPAPWPHARQPPTAPLAAARAPGRRLSVSVSASTFKWSNRDNQRDPRAENVPGSFFVDHTCIDCDTCRWMAPDTFGRVGQQSAVVRQPADREGRVAALKALLSCPTYSIHATERSSEDLRAAQQALPAPVPGVPRGADGSSVLYTGWATEKSFAGCAYLIVRPTGNILVDSPRYNPILAKRIEELGGVRHIFLTHKDDVGDHEAWARKFGAQRILHEIECNERQGTDKVEIKLTGQGPWALHPDGSVTAAPAPSTSSGYDAAADAASDVTMVLTPGHTRGHVCLYHSPTKSLLSGDHLCSADGDVPSAPQDQLHVFTDFNWYSVPQQLDSVAALLQYDWLHVLPAHGRRAHLRDAAHRLAAVSGLLRSHGHTAPGAGGTQQQQQLQEARM